MPTQGANGGLGGAVKEVAEHASSIARLELELAVLELKKKVVALGLGIGLALGAAIFGVFMLGFGIAAVAAAIATALPWWLSLLIVTGALGLLAGTLGALALGSIRKATPPVPEQAIMEAKMTTATLKS